MGVQAPLEHVREFDDVLPAQPRLANQEADDFLQLLVRDPYHGRAPLQHHGDVILVEAKAPVERKLLLQIRGLQLGEGGEDVDEHGVGQSDAGVLDSLHDLLDAVRLQQDDTRLDADELGYCAGCKAMDVTEHGERPEEGGLVVAADGERHPAQHGDDVRIGAKDLAEGTEERGEVILDAAVEDSGVEGDDLGEERRGDADGAKEVQLGLESPGGIGCEDLA
uniref:Uncharacterized protein n=1 Tax=Oryza brachyantha TaxID=4533 RepID=J3M762_ORYBR